MKRILLAVFAFLLLFALCGCRKTRVNKNADVTLTFIYGEENIEIVLPEEEAEKVIAILDGKAYDPIGEGIPSCGFHKNISLKVGNRVFAIACDACNCIRDLGNLRYFTVDEEDMDYIHVLFEKYGGYFPCI